MAQNVNVTIFAELVTLTVRNDAVRVHLTFRTHCPGNFSHATKFIQKITPCPRFDDQAEEAVQFYTAIFKFSANVADQLLKVKCPSDRILICSGFERRGHTAGAYGCFTTRNRSIISIGTAKTRC